MKQKVIVLGNDHTNSMGVIQSLGIEGYYVIAFVWGVKSGLLRTSHYLKEQYSAASAEDCIDKIIAIFSDSKDKIPIIPCCDTAALYLEINKNKLTNKFIFEYSTSDYTLEQLQQKDLQVSLAKKTGFNTPLSVEITTIENIDNIPFNAPYLIKPLMSICGSKNDIIVCSNIIELKKKSAEVLSHTSRILVQQYIDKDYEISILGCGMRSGDTLVPAKEIKLTIFPEKTGLESKAIMQKLEDAALIAPIESIIKKIGYVGLFSVELMHNVADNKYYFTEINLRNDGAQPFVRKYGVNLPVIHVNDLLGLETKKIYKYNPGLYLWEMHHYQAWRHHNISFKTWITDIIKSKGFLITCKNDYKPFFRQFQSIGRGMLRMKKKNIEYYK